jgi:hypothetical protein
MTRLTALLSAAALAFGLTHAIGPNQNATDVIGNCSCGFLDPDTNQVWTDAIIVYFNETLIDREVWDLPQYEHIKEQGWNAIYRAGADGSLANANDTDFDLALNRSVNALELRLNASTDQHLVMGANLATRRRDIQYGMFETGMKPPSRQSAGTALSMLMRYNSSEGFNVDFMNMDDPTDACITNLINGEWPSNDTITNFTTIAPDRSGHNPFNTFTSARVFWNQTAMGFWLNGNQTRFVTEADRSVPTAAQALELLTWSTGDDTYMEGPPLNRYTSSHVLYVRAFFNSSVWTDAQHLAFDQSCYNSDKVCLMSDTTLRNSTLINSDASLLVWEDLPEDDRIHKMAGIVASIFSAFGVVALINAFFRRVPWSKLSAKSRKAKNDKTLRRAVRQSFHAGDADNSSTNSDPVPDVPRFSDGFRTSGIATPLPVYGDRSGTQTPAPAYEANGRGEMLSRTASISSYRHMAPSPTNDGITSNRNSDEKDIKGLDIIDETPWAEARARASGIYYKPDEKIAFDEPEVIASTSPAMTVTEKGKRASVTVQPFIGEKDQPTEEVVTAESLPAIVQHAPKTAGPTKRIDYLAGLVAVACIGVTLHHWCQTFWPYITEGYGNTQHYPGVERWIGIFVGSFALTQLWIGPFFLTATRFLSTNYLKNGNLEDIAKKMMRRAPRLFVPIIITSLLQFFLLSLDLQHFLLWSPSVTWSDWPYVVPQGNFAQWMNNMVELGYLYPGAVPEIVPHYCIGVLWTVPVQLQMTYVVLVAAVLIRNVKTPWKRFAFYTAFIITGWYARVSDLISCVVSNSANIRNRAGLLAIGVVSFSLTWKPLTNGVHTSRLARGSTMQSSPWHSLVPRVLLWSPSSTRPGRFLLPRTACTRILSPARLSLKSTLSTPTTSSRLSLSSPFPSACRFSSSFPPGFRPSSQPSSCFGYILTS